MMCVVLVAIGVLMVVVGIGISRNTKKKLFPNEKWWDEKVLFFPMADQPNRPAARRYLFGQVVCVLGIVMVVLAYEFCDWS